MIKRACKIIKFCGIILICSITFYNALSAQVITVNSNLDDPAANPAMSPLTTAGNITLRSAIQYANSLGGANTITFNIPGTTSLIIAVGTGVGVAGQALPQITSRLTINGYTQAGASMATSTRNASIPIILNGAAVNVGMFQDGLTLGAGSNNSVIRGLVIQGFPENGINVQNGMGQSILGNYIGTNRLGTSGLPNGGNGIYIGANASAVSIGSSNGAGIVGNRNIISGQQSTGGTSPVNGAGVLIEGKNNRVIGNYIGTNAVGVNAIPNRTGVYILATMPTVALNNNIRNNIIAFNNGTGANEGSGVIVDGTNRNVLLSNSIYGNRNDGISLINNGNDNLNFPTLTSANISGTTLNLSGNFGNLANANSSYIIQFFTNPAASLATQGQAFTGQSTLTADTSGNVAFSDLPFFSNALAGQFASATITLLSSTGVPLSTSAYSLNLTLAQGAAAGSIDTSVAFDAFPGIRAQAVVIDSVGRIIVGGLDGSIVRYNSNGTIDLTYAPFPGMAVKAMVIDANNNIIAVGAEGHVVRYNSAGAINLTFASFPGVLANAVIFDANRNIIVGGLESTIVRYSTSGATAGTIITTFDPFPGIAVNGLALMNTGQIIACGLKGQVVRYNPAGTLAATYEAFPGKAANSVVIDSQNRAIVVGKTLVTTAVQSTASNIPLTTTTTSTNIVRYNTNGAIDLVFAPFAGLDVQKVILDMNSNVIVCGLESLVAQYNPSSGTINFTFSPFPGINAMWMALTAANEVVVVGWRGQVVRYYN